MIFLEQHARRTTQLRASKRPQGKAKPPPPVKRIIKHDDDLTRKLLKSRQAQAKTASKRVAGVAEQRLQRLQRSAGELQEQVSELEPYAAVVQKFLAGQTGAQKGGKARGRGAKKSAERELLDAYSEAFGLALDLELQEEWEESEGRLRTWTRARLEAEGLAMFELHASPDTTLFKDTIIRMYHPNRVLPSHQFSQGDIVLLSHGTSDFAKRNSQAAQAARGAKDVVCPIDMDNAFEAVVVDYSARWIRVALPTSIASSVRGPNWRMDMYANTVGYERSLAAVQQFAQGPADPDGDGTDPGLMPTTKGQARQSLWCLLSGALPAGFNTGNPDTSKMEALASQPAPWTQGGEGSQRLKAARQVAAQLSSGSGLLQLPPSQNPAAKFSKPAKRTATGLAVNPAQAREQEAGQQDVQGIGSGEQQGQQHQQGQQGQQRGGKEGRGLNPSQANAVRASLGRVLSLWQGPPGSGKTRTLLRLIAAAVSALPKQKQVLAIAASNVAVDNMTAGLLEMGIDVVRVGQPVKLSAGLQGCSLEARMAATPRGKAAQKLRQRAASLAGSEAWLTVQEALRLEEAAAQGVLFSCQVVACTCIGAGDPRVQSHTYPLCVLDEATQATEPACLVPIMMAKVESLLLVGDPQQLPPTVRSRDAEQLGLGTSLFLRLQSMGLKPMLLDTQYRMHPSICAFPSKAFYDGRLKSFPSAQDRPMLPGFPWPNPKVPVCFVPVTEGREERTGSSGEESAHSLRNVSEAQQVVSIVQQLLDGRGLPKGCDDIGIVSPYQGQVRLLQQAFASNSKSKKLRSSVDDEDSMDVTDIIAEEETWPSSTKSSSSTSSPEIKTVDGFQGREKEVIILSAVRSNAARSVGFLSDYRRLNVAITRAKRGLVVVGNPDTLRSDKTWAAWLKWAEQHDAWLSQ